MGRDTDRFKTWLEDVCEIRGQVLEREFFIDNLLVRIHFIIVMIRWTGLAPCEFEFPFPGSLTWPGPNSSWLKLGSPENSQNVKTHLEQQLRYKRATTILFWGAQFCTKNIVKLV